MTPEQLAEARTLIASGATYAEVAQRFSVGLEVVTGYFSTEGIHKQMRRERNDRIFEMMKDGRSAREISEEVGLSLAMTKNIMTKQRRYAPYL